MRITPVRNNAISHKITNKNNKVNINKTDIFQKSNKVAFSGLTKLQLKMQGLRLQNEAQRNLKQSDKISAEADKIKERSENILLRAQIHQAFANQILEEELPAINTARGFCSKINFTDLEDGIVSKASKPLSDGGAHISEVRQDGTSRQIFIRGQEVYIYECDEYQEMKQMFLFDLFTHELKSVGKNFRMSANYSMFDEKYAFQNGELVLFDEGLVVNNEATYEKALTRFSFKDGKLVECVEGVENIEDFKGELGRVFCFSDDKLYEYDEGVKKDFNTDLTSSKKRFMFEPNGELSFCLIKDMDIDDAWTNFKKLFEYRNRSLERIDLGVIDNNEEMTSKKTFGFKDGKLAYCNIGEKTNEQTIFDRQIIF